MSSAMDKQNRRAARILRNFAGYVEAAATEADAERALRDTPTIARTKPHTWARLRRKVARRLFEKGEAHK